MPNRPRRAVLAARIRRSRRDVLSGGGALVGLNLHRSVLAGCVCNVDLWRSDGVPRRYADVVVALRGIHVMAAASALSATRTTPAAGLNRIVMETAYGQPTSVATARQYVWQYGTPSATSEAAESAVFLRKLEPAIGLEPMTC